MTARQPGQGFRPDLEGLRGVAVLLVVGCHSGIPWCAGGFVGVDVFFVLSGYLITGLLVAEYRTTSGVDLPAFFARRLMPESLLVSVVTLLTAVAFLTPQEIIATAQAAAATGLYVSNLFFDRNASDYFAPDVAANPLLHTWSLGVEEQFYLVWPLVMLWVSRGARRVARSAFILVAIAVLSFACCIYASGAVPTFAFYELPARAWEFAAGGLLALVPVSRIPSGSRGAVAGGIFGFALIAGTALVLKGGAGFPGWVALLPVVGTLAMLHAGAISPHRGISVPLSTPPLQFLGARSYAWYLWHWPFVVYAGIFCRDITVGGKIAAAVASLLVAMVTYRLVARPVRENAFLGARSALSLGIGAGAALLSVAAAWTLIGSARQQLMLDQKYQAIGAATADAGKLSKDCWSEGHSFEAKVCVFGNSGASPAIVLFGDSHAMQWFDPLLTAIDLQGWRLITLVRPGCAASDINPHRQSDAANHCRQWRSSAIDKIVEIHPAVVLMASYNGWTLRGDTLISTLLSADEIRSGTQWTLDRFARSGIRVVVMRDTPLPPFSIPVCVGRLVGSKLAARESCDFDASIALNAAAFSAERTAAEGLTNVHFLDMSDVFCPGDSCAATQQEMLIYRDDNHLTGTFAQSLAPVLRQRLLQLLGDTSRLPPS